MAVYMKVVGPSGEDLSDTIDESARSYDVLLRTLSLLLGSEKEPFKAYANGWRIARVENDPAGFLPWFMCMREGNVFGSHEAEVVLEHLRNVNFTDIDDTRLKAALSEAYDYRLRSEIPYKADEVLAWFRMARDELLVLLMILEQHEGSRLEIY
jgi:hypothetical protein